MPNKPKIERAKRDLAIRQLTEFMTASGIDRIPTPVLRAAAREAGYSERQLLRQLKPICTPAPKLDFLVDEAVENEIFRCSGNMAQAHARLFPGDRPVPSLSTFKRAVKSQMGTTALAAAKRGHSALRAARVHAAIPDDEPGEQYLLDHTELPIYVIPDGRRTATRPWLTLLMDQSSRYPLSWVLTFGRPSAEEVRAVLISAITVRTAPDGKTLVGGRPRSAVWDQGKEFLSDLITESCLRLQIDGHPLPGYSGHLKGRLERFFRTLKHSWLNQLPGYSDVKHGPIDLRGESLAASHALPENAFLTELQRIMDNYATTHVIRTIGSTPLVRWQQRTVPLDVVPAEQLWQDMMQSTDRPKVSKAGVRFRGLDYLDPFRPDNFSKLIGQRVEVRFLPHRLEFIEVFHNGLHVGTGVPAKSMRPDDVTWFVNFRAQAQRDLQRQATRADRLRDAHPNAVKLKKFRANGQSFLGPAAPDPLTEGQDATLEEFLFPKDGGSDQGQLF